MADHKGHGMVEGVSDKKLYYHWNILYRLAVILQYFISTQTNETNQSTHHGSDGYFALLSRNIFSVINELIHHLVR